MNKNYDLEHILGNNLRLLRNQRNLSQLDLALKAGRSQTFINNIENGKKWVSPKTLSILCRELEVYPYQFFLTDDIPGIEAGYNAMQEKEKLMLDMYDLLSKYKKEEES